MNTFSGQEMRRYWELYSARWARLDYARDPDGLENVCYAGVSSWINRYYAYFQRKVYRTLFSRLPAPAAGARALDIGCGAGRWCRFLAERGYRTVGIDLQPELMEINRRRYPQMTFERAAIQDYTAEEPFDIVSSVTVIQHIPADEHALVIRKIRSLVKTGGYALILENIRDHLPHVFAHPIAEWQARFQQAGFRLIARRRYDYSVCLRTYEWLTRRVVIPLLARHRHFPDTSDLTPERFLARLEPHPLRVVNDVLRSLAVIPDAVMETCLVAGNVPLPSVHCGFLFEAQ